MKYVATLSFLALSLISSCSTAGPHTEPALITVSSPPVLETKKVRTCPAEASVHGYVNMMPGPGFDREKVAAGITAEIVATGHWAAAHKQTDDPDVIVLSVFYSTSPTIKPPAKRFRAHGKPLPFTLSQEHSSEDQQHRYSVRFSIVKPSARRVVLQCGAEEIAEGIIHAAH